MKRYPTVIITTSGTGSRLGQYTQYTNKSLVKVGDSYAICKIIESYPLNTDFIITIGYYGNLVRDFLELAYPERKFTFVEVDKYEGEGSSLVYSLLQAKSYAQKPFYFHCCDTIIDGSIPDVDTNTVFVSKGDDTTTYSSIEVDESSKVIQINGKGAQKYDYLYIGLSFIQDFSIFWKSLEKIYNTDPTNSSLSDIHGIQEMLKKQILFEYEVVDKFYDTGSLHTYTQLQNHFKSKYTVLEKGNESLCFLKDKVIKYINDKSINEKRYLRGVDLYPLTPKILNKRDHFIVMEFVKGELLAESKNYGEIYSLLQWAQEHLWKHTKVDSTFKERCVEFYKTKTIKRIQDIPFLTSEKNTINNVEVGSIEQLIKSVDFDELSTTMFSKFHGDFILDNILKTDSGYCLLDWRHEFDKELYYGDIYYDLAKLRHNIIFNHNNILNDLYSIEYKDNSVNVELKCNYTLMSQLGDFEKFCEENKYSIKKIKILTAIIWLNMSSLYEGKLREFLYYFGKLNLHLSNGHRNH